MYARWETWCLLNRANNHIRLFITAANQWMGFYSRFCRIRNVIKSKCFVCVHHNLRVIIRATVALISQGGAKAKVKVYKIRFARLQHQSWLIWSNLTVFFSTIGSYRAAKNSLISPGVFFLFEKFLQQLCQNICNSIIYHK